MTTIDYARRIVIPAALTLLPPAMTSPAAAALLLAIGWQETRFAARNQFGGPARGFWQFEMNGVRAVLSSPSLARALEDALQTLCYPTPPTSPFPLYDAIAGNDVLAAVFARLLVWSYPGALPTQGDPDLGWRIYQKTWQPGAPRPETWAEAWAQGWASAN